MTERSTVSLIQEIEDWKEVARILLEVVESSATYCEFCTETMSKALKRVNECS